MYVSETAPDPLPVRVSFGVHTKFAKQVIELYVITKHHYSQIFIFKIVSCDIL